MTGREFNLHLIPLVKLYLQVSRNCPQSWKKYVVSLGVPTPLQPKQAIAVIYGLGFLNVDDKHRSALFHLFQCENHGRRPLGGRCLGDASFQHAFRRILLRFPFFQCLSIRMGKNILYVLMNGVTQIGCNGYAANVASFNGNGWKRSLPVPEWAMLCRLTIPSLRFRSLASMALDVIPNCFSTDF